MKHLRVLTVLGLLMSFMLVSCEREMDGRPGNKGEGTLTVSLMASGELSGVTTRTSMVIPELELYGKEEKLKEFMLYFYQDETLTDQWNYGSNMDALFKVGAYRVEAVYGKMEEEGFELPVFTASQDFVIKDGEETSVSLTAKLANARVKIACTEAFKSYFSDYQIIANSVIFSKEETRVAYFKPGKVDLSVKVKKQGADKMVDLKVKTLDVVACSEYRVNMDVDAGSATLNITFDGTVEDAEPVTIPVSDADLNAAAPELIPENFQHDVALNIQEGMIPEKSPVRAVVSTGCGIRSCVLKTVSASLQEQGWPAEIDLMTVSDWSVLTRLGLKAKGFDVNSEGMAVIDLTGVLPNLVSNPQAPEHVFTMELTDQRSHMSKPLVLKVVLESNQFKVAAPVSVAYGTELVTLDVTLKGDISKVQYEYVSSGSAQALKPLNIQTAQDQLTHAVTFLLPALQTDMEKELKITATYGAKKLTASSKIAQPVMTAAFASGNIWTNRAYITAKETQGQTDLTDMSGIALFSQKGAEWSQIDCSLQGACFLMSALTPATEYVVQLRKIQNGHVVAASEAVRFTTESELQIPGSDMESWVSDDGANWKRWYPRATRDEDTKPGWTTLNGLTTSENSVCAYRSNSGTEPSGNAHSGSYAAEIKTIGWGGNTTAARPISIIKNITPGELFLGTMKNTTPQYGYPFASRPSKMIFWYKYEPDGNHQFSARIVLENRSDKGTVVLAKAEFAGGAQSSYIKQEMPLVYEPSVMHLSATHIRIEFNSGENSKKEVDKASILNSSRHVGNKLYIDDIQLEY